MCQIKEVLATAWRTASFSYCWRTLVPKGPVSQTRPVMSPFLTCHANETCCAFTLVSKPQIKELVKQLSWEENQKNPRPIICHHSEGFNCFVKISARFQMSRHPVKRWSAWFFRRGLEGLHRRSQATENELSLIMIWRRPAKSIANLFSEGAFGIPSRWRWSKGSCNQSQHEQARTVHSQPHWPFALSWRTERGTSGKERSPSHHNKPSSLQQKSICRHVDLLCFSNPPSWKFHYHN